MSTIIDGKIRTLFDSCIEFSRTFLDLPQTIELYAEDCPSARFPSDNNAAESDRNNIYFNRQWLDSRIKEHRDDVEFFLFHELRHIYQYRQIDYLNARMYDEYKEPLAVIRNWRDEFKNYTRNVDEKSQNENLKQEVERDANAYALLLVLIFNRKTGISLSLPEPARTRADNDIMEYKKRKEFGKYIS